MSNANVRALFRAAVVPDAPSPYDRVLLRAYYPARFTGTNAERVMGVVAADDRFGPLPVILFFNGANCPPDGYGWLMSTLAARGYVAVTFAYVAEDLPGFPALSAGVDMARVMPARYGSGPTSRLILPLLEALDALNQETAGAFRGAIDLSRVVLGGHSAGGTMALQNARTDWFPSVVGAFAYAGHTVPASMLGYPAGTVLPAGQGLPILLLEAEHDGVIAASAGRYTGEGDAAPVEHTFWQGGSAAGSVMVTLRGANHFSVMYPPDPTVGRGFLEANSGAPDAALREALADWIGTYCDSVTRADSAGARQYQQWARHGHPSAAHVYSKDG